MRGPYNTNQVIVECDCDCATQCPQRRIGSSPRCMVVVERATLDSALRELDRRPTNGSTISGFVQSLVRRLRRKHRNLGNTVSKWFCVSLSRCAGRNPRTVDER